MINPAVPLGVEVVFIGVAICAVAVAVVALVSLARTSGSMSGVALAIWVVAIIIFPVIASICWLAIGLPASKRSRITAV